MSNFLVIATVTATLGDLLRKAISTGEPGGVPGAIVTTRRPDDTQNGSPQPGVNIYLYQVTPNAALRNNDLPTRDSNGIVVQQPQAAFDLHYLLTCYGNDAKLEPQRLLGLIIRTLHSRSLLTREKIRNFIDGINSGDPYEDLKTSDLADQIELVRFSPTMLNLEELSKLWSIFFQTPYTLSMAYQASVVLIEGIETPRTTLPVRERSVYGTTVQRPVIEKLKSQKPEANAPELEKAQIEVGDILILEGKRLLGDQTVLKFDDFDITSDLLLEHTETHVKVKLNAPPIPEELLRVGKHSLQVVHHFDLGKPPIPHKVLESNSVTFTLRPSISIEE